jgi:predicted transposase YdaD
VAGIWDSNLKHPVGANPEQFIRWLLPGAHYIRELSAHLNRGIDIDILYEVTLDGERVIFHLEFQRSNNANMANRVLEYNVFASCKFDCTVISFVIYLKKESKLVEPPLIRKVPDGREILRLDFTNIKLWEIPTSELRQTKLIGLLPLLALTREGGSPEVVDEAINGIEHSSIDNEIKANLLSITLTLATLTLDKPEDKDWLRRRFRMYQDILRDTEIYQIIMQEGVEKGHQQELQDLRQILSGFIQARFQELVPLATEQTAHITDTETLKHLTLKVGLAQTLEEARQLLLGAVKKGKH